MYCRAFVVLATLACVYAMPQNPFKEVLKLFSGSLRPNYDADDQDSKYEETVAQVRQQSAGIPNAAVGRLLENWNPDKGPNPEELGTYNQGDILHPPKTQRNGIINTAYRWPKGVIPFKITGTFTSTQRNMIMSAMEEYHRYTCIRFVPYSGQTDYVSIESGNSGCWSNLGRIGGMQRVNLQVPGCLYYLGTAVHELLHTVGFYHEQSRMDRDPFVTVNWQNISPGAEHNFNTFSSTAFGVKYDYGSVMHYSAKAFSKNGMETLTPKQYGVTIGQRKGFSVGDITKIRAMYKCNGSISNL